jgi:enoyl-CoA hydratase/carnithine racemase
MTEFQHLRITRHSSAHWRVTFDNPPINLFYDESMPELERMLDQAAANDDLKVLVFDSANPDFFIAHFSPRHGAAYNTTSGDDGLLPLPRFLERLTSLPVVTISAVRGRARGFGAEFILATDIRFASLEKAVFAQIEIGSGIIPGGGGLEYLPRLVGRGRALEIVFSGDDYDARTAESYGWINRAIPDAEFEGFVEAFTRRVLSFDKRAIGEIKRLVNAHTDRPTVWQLDETLRVFFEAMSWPGVMARRRALAQLGADRPGDFELNYGARLEDLAAALPGAETGGARNAGESG